MRQRDRDNLAMRIFFDRFRSPTTGIGDGNGGNGNGDGGGFASTGYNSLANSPAASFASDNDILLQYSLLD